MSLYRHITRARMAQLIESGAFGEGARHINTDLFMGGDDYHTAMIGACLGQLVDALNQVPAKQGEAA